MKMITFIHADLIKLRHTPHLAIHTVVPLLGSILYIFYFVNYGGIEEYKKIKLLTELTATVFPLLISIIVGINISQEEKAARFQNLLAVPDRAKSILAKLSVLYLSGVTSLAALYTPLPFGSITDSPCALHISSEIALTFAHDRSLTLGCPQQAFSIFVRVRRKILCLLFLLR